MLRSRNVNSIHFRVRRKKAWSHPYKRIGRRFARRFANFARAFPSAYWRDIDKHEKYPQEFVDALTASEYLAALIPEEYGGAGLGVTEAGIILEEINRSGGNPGACHAQMYTMGTLLRHGSDEQKRRYLPANRQGRSPPAGLCRHRAECRLGDHAHRNARRSQGRSLHRQRAEDLHLAREAVGLDAPAGPHDAL